MAVWKNLLDEDILKQNINFAAMFVLNYECLKDYVVNRIREFYADNLHLEENKIICKESEAYKEQVRTLGTNIEDASLRWFVQSEAITQLDYEDYNKIRKRRNDIIHEFLKNLSVGFDNDDRDLFDKILAIYAKIDKWWINEIEIPTSAEKNSRNHNPDLVFGGQAMVLSMINSIILEGKGSEYKEMLAEIIENLQ